MNDVFKSLPVSLRMILKDPVNLLLAIIPTVFAIVIYILTIIFIFNNAEFFGDLVRNYVPDNEMAGWLGKLLTAIFIIFVFLIMSWTFVLVVGIISAPFNSMLSSRVETILTGKSVSQDKKRTFKEVFAGVGKTFKNEFKKLIFIIVLTALAFILNLFPLFYPVGMFLLALLLALQFVDYSWSRHDMHFRSCVKDAFENLFSYAGSGFIFLILIAVPLINTLVPVLATSYFTVLWLHRHGKIS